MISKRILVADDDPVTRRILFSLLSKAGHDVLLANDGEAALELAQRSLPDLLISDLVMPYRDGFSLLKAIRSQSQLLDVPVVILSMRDREEDIVRGLLEGADDYIVKPFHARELVVRVEKVLGRSH